MVQPEVFDRLLIMVLELAEEGKEGRPLGTTFILGDHEKVMSMSSQMVINPFSAVPESECNILDPALKETIREFSTIDGAFIVRDDGVVLAAGRHLSPSVETSELPQGLGGPPQKRRRYHGTDQFHSGGHIGINRGCSDFQPWEILYGY